MFKLNHLVAPVFALTVSVNSLFAQTPPDGFTALYNGTDLNGWHGNNPHRTNKAEDRAQSLHDQQTEFLNKWSVKDGALYNDGDGPFATTDKVYGDFELMLEYKTVAQADSGIYLRGNPQVQIWDTSEAGGKWKYGAEKGSGGLWNNRKNSAGKDALVHADRPFGDWNQVHIRMVGSRVWVVLNDQTVVDGAHMQNFWTKGKTAVPATGPIHLQTHGGAIHWRHIFIREIGDKEAQKILTTHSSKEDTNSDLGVAGHDNPAGISNLSIK
ncbi:MAG: DUF1080 domain-containing protein [Lentimonas sp.]